MADVKKKKGSDFIPRALDCDKQVKLEDVLDKEIEIEDWVELIGEEDRPYLNIRAKLKGATKTIGFNCSGIVVRKQLKGIAQNTEMPFWITITKPEGKRYYTIV